METLENKEKLQDFKTKLLSVNSNFKFLCSHVANENGYSLNFFNLLNFISENEGMTLAELAESLEMDRGNLSRLLNKQIKIGYVEKKMDAIDNRKIRIFITKAGQIKIDEFNQLSTENLNKLLNILSEEEFENFMISLSKLDLYFRTLSKKLKD